MEPLARQKSWNDYRKLPDDEQWELVDGHLYAMAAPSTIHQVLSRELLVCLTLHFRGKTCQVFSAPLDVKLSEYDSVQPDLVVVCDRTQILETHIEGPPTLAVEILSQSSHRHDRIRKFRLYAKFGVQEYWLVHPVPAMVEVFYLQGETYIAHGTYSDSETLLSPSFPDLRLDLSSIFPYQEIDEVRESTPAMFA